MIRLYAEFDTEAEAELWRDGMYRSYHPAGYSTHIQITKVTRAVIGTRDTETIWIAHGSRAESCD